MNADPDVLKRLARESGSLLRELGVCAEDTRWIRRHAETIAGLARRPRANVLDYFSRLARRAARKAR